MNLQNRACIIFLLFLFASNSANGQLKLAISPNPKELVEKVLLSEAPGILLDSVRYIGAKQALGQFEAHMIYNDFVPKGIIMSTGHINNALGPNSKTNCSGKNQRPGYIQLSNLVNNRKSFDAAVLSIHFTAISDSLCFRYFFASEEYPEFVDRQANDVFAFLLTNKSTGKTTNLAVLPNIGPISVDAVNNKRNSELFRTNFPWNDKNVLQWNDRRKEGELAMFFQFDGFTVLMETGARLVPGDSYELIIAIADVADDLYDSAILIEANSLGTKPINKTYSADEALKQIFHSTVQQHNDSTITTHYPIPFSFGSAIIQSDSAMLFLDNLAQFIQTNPVQSIEIIGHTDSIGTISYNQLLSEKRANEVCRQLIVRGISVDLFKPSGQGEQNPISTNANENRRVEFRFKMKK